MEIKIKKEELTKAISSASKIIPNKPVEEILKNVLVKRNGDNIEVIATNLDQATIYQMPFELIKDGPITETVLPFDLLKDITPKLKDEEINMKVEEKKVILKDSNGEFTLFTFNPEAFAIIPEVNGEIKFSLPFGELVRLIENTIFATSKKEESRKEFKGVYFDIKGDGVNLVATDAMCLALNKIKQENLPQTSFIVPWKALDALTYFQYPKDTTVTIETRNNNLIKFSFPNLSLISLLIDGQYPQYESVIPGEAEFYAIVNKEEILDALDLISVFSKKSTGRINFTFSHGDLIISSPGSDIGQGKKVIKCNTNAEIALQFYAEKVIEGIEHVEDENVYFGMQDGLRPVLIKGEKKEDYIYVIMPQRPVE